MARIIISGKEAVVFPNAFETEPESRPVPLEYAFPPPTNDFNAEVFPQGIDMQQGYPLYPQYQPHYLPHQYLDSGESMPFLPFDQYQGYPRNEMQRELWNYPVDHFYNGPHPQRVHFHERTQFYGASSMQGYLPANDVAIPPSFDFHGGLQEERGFSACQMNQHQYMAPYINVHGGPVNHSTPMQAYNLSNNEQGAAIHLNGCRYSVQNGLQPAHNFTNGHTAVEGSTCFHVPSCRFYVQNDPTKMTLMRSLKVLAEYRTQSELRSAINSKFLHETHRIFRKLRIKLDRLVHENHQLRGSNARNRNGDS